MNTTPGGMVILFSEEYPAKKPYPISVVPLGTDRFVRPPKPEKAPAPMLVTLLGIVMPVRLLQPEKAESPILVTPLGIVQIPPFPSGAFNKTVCALLNKIPSLLE